MGDRPPPTGLAAALVRLARSRLERVERLIGPLERDAPARLSSAIARASLHFFLVVVRCSIAHDRRRRGTEVVDYNITVVDSKLGTSATNRRRAVGRQPQVDVRLPGLIVHGGRLEGCGHLVENR